MPRCISIELMDKPSGEHEMKCPECGCELRKITQHYPAEYHMKPNVTFDHPNNHKCKWSGFTNSPETWKSRIVKS